jgi:hypothetical protein
VAHVVAHVVVGYLLQVFVHDICQFDNIPTIYLHQCNNIHVVEKKHPFPLINNLN